MMIVKRAIGLALVTVLQLVMPSAVGGEISKETWLAHADALLGRSASKDERLKAAEAICENFNVRYGAWTTYFQVRYSQPETWPDDGELDKMERAFWVGAKLRAKEFGAKDFRVWTKLGEACLVKERYADALRSYEKAIEVFGEYKPSAGRRAGQDFAHCLYGRANALLGLGRMDEAKAALENYIGRGLPEFNGRYDERIDHFAQIAVHDMEGGDLDRLKMPRFTGAKAFPEPQQAEYSENFVSVRAYDLVVKGLEAKDRRLELLEVKFKRFGASRRKGASFKVSVEVDPATAVFSDLRDAKTFAEFRSGKFAARAERLGEKAVDISPREFCDYMEKEAYVLEVKKSGASIIAKTKQGALWGIVSLIQLWDQEKHRIRLAKIRDWPDVETRGYLGTFWEGTLEFTLFNKLNSVCHQTHPCYDNKFRPVNWYIEEFMGRQFHDFGLELFFGNCWMTHCPQMAMSSPRTLPYRISVCKRYAAAHIGVYYPLDDIRYPICEPDRKAYGDQVSKVDGEHQNAIFQAVVKDYPDWRFIVCPPPYWGPDGRCSYPEPRDHYLETWSKELDPRIEAYWTGPRVKSWRFEPYHNKWVLAKYGRRPYLFQNGILWHNLLNYTVDEIEWPGIYCEGTLDKVLKGYHLNCHTPLDTPRISSLADALWDLGRYDRRRATEIGLAQLSGEKMFSLLAPALDDLTYFDKYQYGRTDERVDLEDRAAMERRSLNVETCWSNATAYAKSIDAPIYGSFDRGVGFMRDVMNRLRNPPDFAKAYKAQLEDIRSVAFRETAFDTEKGHAYASPVDFSGGVAELVKHAARDSREWSKERGVLYRTIKRSGTAHAKATMRFTCETFPPGCDYRLNLSATTAGKPASVRLSVNGKKFFEGDPKTGTDPFMAAMRKFTIPEKLLKRDNVLEVENLTPGTDAESAEGCYRISYAVVRSSEEDSGTGPSVDLEL